MRKDATEFRLRFLRWKSGELVYDKGRAIPHYEDGSDGNNIMTYSPKDDVWSGPLTMLDPVVVTGNAPNKQKGLYPVRYKFKGFDNWVSPKGAGNMTVMPEDPEMVFFAPIVAGAGIAASPVISSTLGSAVSGIKTAGDALAATVAGQRLTSGLNFLGNAVKSSKAWPWIDAGLTSAFGAHGIDKVRRGDIHNVGDVVETGLDLLPLSQLARPIVSTAGKVGNAAKNTPKIIDNVTRKIFPSQEVFPEGLLNNKPLIAGAVDKVGEIDDIGRVTTPLIDFEDDYLTLKHWMENVPEKDFHEIIGQPKSFFENREKIERFQKFFRHNLNKYLFNLSKVNISNSPEVMLERLKLSNLFDSDWYKKHVENLSDKDLFINSQLDAIFNTPVFSYKIQKPGIGGYFEPNPLGYGTAYIDDNVKNGGLFYSELRAGNIGHELGHGAGHFNYLHTNPPTKLNERSFLFTKPEYYADYDETRTRFLNVAANELWEYRNPDYFFERTMDKIPNSNYTDILYGYDRDFSKNYMRTFKSIIPYLIGGATFNIPTITNDKR